MNIQVVKAALVGLVLSVSSFANASLIKDNLTNIITDNTNTNQSLDWFSLTATTGYSFDEMVLELENQESKFYGFSYATFSDLTTLFSNTGWVTSINDHTKPKNGRTAPVFVIADERSFETEKNRLVDYIEKTQQLGASHFDQKESHSFGALSTQEWNILFSKHLDHHLQQFGV